MKFLSCLLLVVNLFAVEHIPSTIDNIKQLKKDNIPIIDIRDSEEWESTGTIPKSYTLHFFDNNKEFNTTIFAAKMQYLNIDLTKKIALIDKDNSYVKIAAPLLEKELNLKIVVIDGGFDNLIKK